MNITYGFMLDGVDILGDAVISRSSDYEVGGLALNEFHTYRFTVTFDAPNYMFLDDITGEENDEEPAASAPASSAKPHCTKPEPQLKNTIMALGQDVAMLVADDPLRALGRFAELLEQIGKVKYYRPKNPRPSAPRVTNRKINKWIKGRADRMTVA